MRNYKSPKKTRKIPSPIKKSKKIENNLMIQDWKLIFWHGKHTLAYKTQLQRIISSFFSFSDAKLRPAQTTTKYHLNLKKKMLTIFWKRFKIQTVSTNKTVSALPARFKSGSTTLQVFRGNKNQTQTCLNNCENHMQVRKMCKNALVMTGNRHFLLAILQHWSGPSKCAK